MSLRNQVESAALWSGLTNLLNQAWMFVIQVLLARMIDPLEFGVVGAVAILLAIATVLVDGGFGQALVQKEQVSAVDISSVFYCNLVISLVLYGALCGSASQIAAYFGESRLASVLPVLGLGLLVTALGQTQQKMLSRNLQFSKLFWVTIPGNLVGGMVGLVLAFAGWGLWALVAFQLVSQTARTLFLWRIADRRFRPGWQFRWDALRAMTPFGAGALGESLVAVSLANVHGFVIARLFPLQELAFYSRANNLQALPATLLTQTIGSVMFPTLASLRDSSARRLRIVREALATCGALVFPAMFGLMALADPLIRVLLTDRWEPSIPLLRWLPLVGIAYTLSGASLTVLRAVGLSGTTFQLALLKNLVVIGTLWVTYRWGLMAIVWGQVASSLFSLFLNAWVLRWRTEYTLRQQLADLLPTGGAAALAAGAAWGVADGAPLPAVLRLVVAGVVLIVVYAAICRWGRIDAYARLEGVLRTRGRRMAERLGWRWRAST